MMKPEGGAEFVRRVRFGEYDVDACVPIIMVSAETGYTSITKARDAGITEFLAKPVSAKFVYDRLAAVICRPRPFVRADSYFGPERRWRNLEPFYERRQRPFEYNPKNRFRDEGEHIQVTVGTDWLTGRQKVYQGLVA